MISSTPLNEKFDTHVRHFQVRVAVRRSVSARTVPVSLRSSQKLQSRYRKELHPRLHTQHGDLYDIRENRELHEIRRLIRCGGVTSSCSCVNRNDSAFHILANQHHIYSATLLRVNLSSEDGRAKQIGELIITVRRHVDGHYEKYRGDREKKERRAAKNRRRIRGERVGRR